MVLLSVQSTSPRECDGYAYVSPTGLCAVLFPLASPVCSGCSTNVLLLLCIYLVALLAYTLHARCLLNIEQINHLIHSYHQTANSKDEIIKHLAKILDNLNYFHPFREGNGRTQREVIRSLALLKGYSAQIRVEQDDEIYNLYMDGTVYGELWKLEKLFDKILKEI